VAAIDPKGDAEPLVRLLASRNLGKVLRSMSEMSLVR
jgi:hypothetical protein